MDPRRINPRGPPPGVCRLPDCDYPVFFDRRVNEHREWCSDQHMRDAIMHFIEEPCMNCNKWPRRDGHMLCSGDYCRYPNVSSQTTPNLAVDTHQRGLQGSYDYPTSIGSSSESHRFYPAGGSDTGGDTNIYGSSSSPYPSSLEHIRTLPPADMTQPVSTSSSYTPEHISPSPPSHPDDLSNYMQRLSMDQFSAPRGPPSGLHRPKCRFRGCNNPTFFDRRAEELREWCSDEHMRAAIIHRIEKPCKSCNKWPRRNGYNYCSGNHCGYPGISQTAPNLAVGAHQRERQGSYGHPPSIGSSSDSHWFYPTGGSNTGGDSSIHLHPGEESSCLPYSSTLEHIPPLPPADLTHPGSFASDPMDQSSAPRGPSSGPICRFPGCDNSVFFDIRVNELREWCSDRHMQAAIIQRIEKPCRKCRVWPRRNGYKLCSGNYCLYRYISRTTPNLTVGTHQQEHVPTLPHALTPVSASPFHTQEHMQPPRFQPNTESPPILPDGFALRRFPSINRVSPWREHRVTIDVLPDDVLLNIFDFDREISLNGLEDIDPAWRLSWWHRLVHVCRRWRNIVFGSPHFLDLKLHCGPRTRIQLIDVWPPLPVVIRNMVDRSIPGNFDFDFANVYHNRVCEIYLLQLTSSQLQRLASAMQEQFPALTHLMLDFDVYCGSPAPILPVLFLGGSTPLLQSLTLHCIPFPALPKLLFSTTHLVYLTLVGIPHTGYFSPEAIVTGLSVLAYLKSLTIEFESPRSRPDRRGRHPSPPARTVLPSLARFAFKGASEYLEDVVARVNAPWLYSIWVTFFDEFTFDIPQLARFIRRTKWVEALKKAHVEFDYSDVRVGPHSPERAFDEDSRLRILCSRLDLQLSSLAQVLTSFFPSIDMVEHLYMYGPRRLQEQEDIENIQWLEFFRPFTSVKNLYVSRRISERIAPALQELIGGVIDVLPALENLFLEEIQPLRPVEEAIGRFVATRQYIGHPVAVYHWNTT